MNEQPKFKVGEFYEYSPKTVWCREGIAEVIERGVFDTYWGHNPSDSSPLSPEEKATAVLLFDSSEYDELDRYCSSSRHRWEQFHPSERKKTTEQHGCHKRWFIKKGAEPDIGTRINNAKARLSEAEQELKSAQWRVESRTKELEELQKDAQ